MEVPSEAFSTLVHGLRNSLTSAVGHCDLLALDASQKGITLGSADKVRQACLNAVALLDAWHQAHLIPFPYSVTSALVKIVVPPFPIPSAFETTIEHVLAHPGYRRGMGILYDRRASEPPTPEYLEQVIWITRRYADRLGKCRWAVVVRQQDAITPQRVRQAAAHVGPASLPGPFTDLNDAMRWLHAGHTPAPPAKAG